MRVRPLVTKCHRTFAWAHDHSAKPCGTPDVDLLGKLVANGNHWIISIKIPSGHNYSHGAQVRRPRNARARNESFSWRWKCLICEQLSVDPWRMVYCFHFLVFVVKRAITRTTWSPPVVANQETKYHNDGSTAVSQYDLSRLSYLTDHLRMLVIIIYIRSDIDHTTSTSIARTKRRKFCPEVSCL